MSSTGVLKIGDLGACKVCNVDSTTAKTQIGSPVTMSPEIYKNQEYGRATDIWSLGVILYQLCTLNFPFEANSLPAI